MNEVPYAALPEPPLFKGFPYILSHFTGESFHVILLPQGREAPDQYEIAWYQALANKLPTVLVQSENEAVYANISAFPAPPIPVPVPRPRYIAFGKLVTEEVIPEEEEILSRYISLSLHADLLNGGGPSLYVGNLAKGGRLATADEINQLRGRQPNGVPTGLQQCATCREWRGICLDSTVPRLVVSVHCRCENNSCCARCGQQLYGYKVNSNYYSEDDRRIWHVPGFCATSHKCPQAVESWVTQPFISLKTGRSVQ